MSRMRYNQTSGSIALIHRLSWVALGFVLLLGMIWPSAEANSQTGAAISGDTKSGYLKSNQSKVFFYDGKWWAIAHNDPNKRWYIWKYDGSAWSKDAELDKSTAYKFDATLNSATGKLYVLGSHTSNTKFWCFTYTSSTASWTKDAGFDVSPDFNNSDGMNPLSLVQAKNSDLWIFRIETSKLQAKRSTDGGLTWSAIIDVKTGLTSASGSVDAVAFTAGGNDHIGVAYGEASATGSKYGFLLHRDSDSNSTWTDESAALTFFGNERADSKVAAATDQNNSVFVFTQNANVTGSEANNTLYKRSNTGAWSKFAVNTAASGLNWKTPAVVANVSNNMVYVMGVNMATLSAEYKTCSIAAEATLSNATPNVLLASSGAAFEDLSAPAPNINAASGLMVCGDNTTTDDVWYNQISSAPLQSPVTVTRVTASPNEANANASYTISFNLGNNGALPANTGSMTARFPANTRVISGTPANQITVNGTTASTVTSDNATREVSITTPVNLANNASVTLVFNTGAQLLNPSNAGNYTLEVFTSKQPTPAASPAYAIAAATTNVTAANVTPSPNTANSAAAYTVIFNLGAHGRLISGTSTMALTFNSATSVTNGSLTGVQVNGVNAAATGNNTNKTVVVTAPAALSLGNNAAVTITLPASILTNPASAGNYTLTVATSVETTPVTSTPYSLVSPLQSPVTITGVTVSPDEANRKAGYTISLKLGNNGALAANTGTISVRFLDNTRVVPDIPANQIMINGIAVNKAISDYNTRQATVTTPVDLANLANVTLIFSVDALLINPSIAGNHNLEVFTSAQPTPAISPDYTISPATTKVSAATVTPSPATTNAAAAYAIAFSLGPYGRLVSGVSTIKLTFNSVTGVAHGNLNLVKVNGADTTAIGDSANKSVTITVPTAITLTNTAAVKINLPASVLTNPANAGTHTLTVATSVEATPVTSNSYTITSVGQVNVGAITVSNNEANATGNYTVPLTLGSSGALITGSSTITLQFPGNTAVPANIAANQISVNGTVANTATSNSSTRQVTITTPVNLANNASVSVVLNAGANLLNPSIAGNYTLQAWTSAQSTPVNSPAYAITAATTSVSAAIVTPSPNTPGSAAAYTIALNLGARGRLISGASTITLTFNNATNVANDGLTGVQVNGVNATATGNSANKTVTITLPATVSLGNSAAVTLNLPATVISNPASAGDYALTVATSVETTPITSNAYSIISAPLPPATDGDYPISGTTGGYDKPHQNRPFYHGGSWWTTARKSSDGNWYLWKLNGPDSPSGSNQGGSGWSAQLNLSTKSSDRPDCHVDSPANKLYIMLAATSSSGSKFLRLSYSGGAWSIDGGFPVTLSSFDFGGERGVVLTKANNGELWAFRYEGSSIEGKRSSDDGQTWSSTFTVKSGVGSSGLFDAVTFTTAGQDYVGVGYAENTASSAIFGFLRHKDGNSDGSWADETSIMPPFDNALGDDHMSMAVSQNNEVYFICKTHPNSSAAAGIGLFKRGAGGSWQNFTIQEGGGWTRPAVVIDESNSELYVLGTEESSPDHGQYKKCALGNEGALKNAVAVEIFDGDSFSNISVPAHRVTSAMNLLICAENTSTNEIWYNVLPLTGGGGVVTVPLAVGNVTINSSAAGQTASYTIPLTLGANGALTGGSGTITVTWPSGTTVPASIANAAVTVNGANAAAVTSNSAARQATVTVPGNWAASASVNLIFTSAAGIQNPATPGNYTLTVATSAETTPITSSSYTIQSAGPIGVGTITLSTNEANTPSSYTVPLTLGSSGALTAGSGTISLQFPNNTSVPSSIAANQIIVNGSAVPQSGITSNTSTRQVTITTPVNLGNNANVSIVLNAGANLLNPSDAGAYTLQAWTSVQSTPVNSSAYTIAAATTSVMAANVTPNPNSVNSAAAYTAVFNLGAHGRLISGTSTMTLTLNSATSVANGSLTGVQVNGVNATATGNSANRTVIVTVPATVSLNDNATVTINLPASVLTNPVSAGDYTLTVATSVETATTASNTYTIISAPSPPATGQDNAIAGTTNGYDKPHQNRSFYHAGTWWTTARKSSDGAWYLWKLSGSTWSAQVNLSTKSSDRPDCHVDSPANKLYIMVASTSSAGSKVFRLSYAGGAWSIDGGFPVALSGFTFSGESGTVFEKAKNGDLWAFRYYSGKLEGRRSSDDGLTWSSAFTVKSSLVSSGLLDAVTFTSGGTNFVGVGYGENTSSSGNFGFLRHKDGDPDGSWTDETGSIPQLSNAYSDDHIAMAVSPNHEIYLVCKTHPNTSAAAGIGLFKRNTSGNWQNFTVQQGGGWTRPAAVIDETNNELYLFGTEESSPGHGQYKKCALGNESALQNTAVVEVFTSGSFNNISVPAHRVKGATGLLVCAESESDNDIWYNLLPISGGGALARATEENSGTNEDVTVSSDQNASPRVAAYPNPFNPATTIRFTLREHAPVRLQIFNINGALVQTLVDGDLDAGLHERRWNGRDSFGHPVASGIYFYRLRMGTEILNGRLEMVK